MALAVMLLHVHCCKGVRRHLGGQVRGEHEEVERFAGVAHSLVDGADGEVRLLGVGRQPDDLRAQLQGLLVPAILKVSTCEMPKMMCYTIVAQRNPIAHLIVPLVQQLGSSALGRCTAAQGACVQLQPVQSRHRLQAGAGYSPHLTAGCCAV